ncbi:protein containing Clp ATPase, partial [Candidatus Thiomargarita nelsonii]
AIMEIVGQHFRPEFINRVDDVVVFHPLAQGEIRAIANLQIDYLRKRLQAQNMGLLVSEAALDHIGAAGFDPVYGARPLRRAIQQSIENPLAQEILAGKFVSGDTIEVDGAMQFKKVVKSAK